MASVCDAALQSWCAQVQGTVTRERDGGIWRLVCRAIGNEVSVNVRCSEKSESVALSSYACRRLANLRLWCGAESEVLTMETNGRRII